MSVFGAFIVWGALCILTFTYVGYPLLLAIASVFLTKPIRPTVTRPQRFAIVMSARNEAGRIGARLSELVSLIKQSGGAGEILVVSDGSTDDTADIVRSFANERVQAIEWTENRGKAAALSAAVASIDDKVQVIIFADVRQRWTIQTIDSLLKNFADPDVGAVSGELMLESSPNVLAGVGVYWRYEKWIRQTESKLHSQIGVTGAVSAVRRELFQPIPDGTILDDVYWPMQVAFAGKRIVFEPEAKAFDQLPSSASGEFWRKVRTLAGNFQLIARCPRLLIPVANPLWGQFVSHKLLRLACPWAWLAMVGTSYFMPAAIYQGLFWSQCLFIVVGFIGLGTTLGGHNRVVSAIGSFVLLNAAAWVAFWCWVLARTDRLWTASSYHPAVKDG